MRQRCTGGLARSMTGAAPSIARPAEEELPVASVRPSVAVDSGRYVGDGRGETSDGGRELHPNDPYRPSPMPSKAVDQMHLPQRHRQKQQCAQF